MHPGGERGLSRGQLILVASGALAALAFSAGRFGRQEEAGPAAAHCPCDWTQGGTGFDTLAVREERAGVRSGLGMVAARDISRSHRVLVVPRRCTLSEEDEDGAPLSRLLAERGFRDLVGAELQEWPEDFGVVALALKLMHERALRARSRHALYIASLPPRDDNPAPLLWRASELEWLNGTGAAEAVSRLRGLVERLHATLLPHVQGLMQGGLPLDGLLESFALVKSRYFRVPGGADGGTVAMLVPLADTINHCGLVRGTWRIERSALRGQSQGASRGDAAREDAARGDVARGDADPDTGQRGRCEDGGAVVVRVGRPFRRGEEVCHSYSYTHGALDFLVQYGFVEEGMPPKAYLSTAHAQGTLAGTHPRTLSSIDQTLFDQISAAVGRQRLRIALKAKAFYITSARRDGVPWGLLCALRLRSMSDAVMRAEWDAAGVRNSTAAFCAEPLRHAPSERTAWASLAALVSAQARALSVEVRPCTLCDAGRLAVARRKRSMDARVLRALGADVAAHVAGLAEEEACELP